jgi:hypothetical protein
MLCQRSVFDENPLFIIILLGGVGLRRGFGEDPGGKSAIGRRQCIAG